MPMRGVAIDGATAAPAVLAIEVTPAAADRSSGSTTARMYDWRAGTSILLRLKWTSRTRAARGSVGMNGRQSRTTFDGQVGEDHRPDEPDPRRQARRDERRQAGQDIGREEDQAEDRGLGAEAEREPVGDEALGHQASGEGVDAHEAREAEHGSPGSMEAETAGPRRPRGRRDLDGRREPPERDEQHQPDQGVADDDGAIAVHARGTEVLEPLDQQAGGEGTGRRRERADEAVPAEDPGSFAIREDVAEGGLLDGLERPDLAATDADHADRGRDHEDPEITRHDEDAAGDGHERGARAKHQPPAHGVSPGRQPQADRGVADQGQGQDQPDVDVIDPECREVQDQDHGQRAVGEDADDTGREQERAVPTQYGQRPAGNIARL